MTGSIQKKSGKFYMLLNTYTPERKRIQKWIGTGLSATDENRDAAQLLLDKALKEYSQYEEPTHRPPPKPAKKKQPELREKISAEIPFADYIRYWLKVKARRAKSVTMQHYTVTANTHIIPYFKSHPYKLCDVDYAVLRDYFDEKATAGRLDGKPGGLAPKTLRHHKVVLALVLKEAKRERLINEVDIELIELREKSSFRSQPYDEDEVKKLIAEMHSEPLFPLIYCTLTLGLRRSEVLGLQWKSVDFNKNSLHIEHTLSMCTEVVELDSTKTASSNRILYFTPEIREMLLTLKAGQEENKRLLGKLYHDTGYVFTMTDGSYIKPDFYSQKFRKLLDKHGLRHIRLHDLRHTAASLLIDKGCQIESVSSFLGHSNVNVTSSIYCHPYENTLRGLCEELTSIKTQAK